MVQETLEQLVVEYKNYFPFPHPSEFLVDEVNHHRLTCSKDLKKRRTRIFE
jgi:hypothetical protein